MKRQVVLSRENGITLVGTAEGEALRQFDKVAYEIEGDVLEWMTENEGTSDEEKQAAILEYMEKVEADGVSMAGMVGYLFRRLALYERSGQDAKKLENVLAPGFEAGEKHIRTQRKKAKMPRTDAHIAEQIKRLSKRPGTAKEKWPDFLTWLDNRGHDPMTRTGDSERTGDSVSYTTENSRGRVQDKTMTLKTFENRLALAKKK